MHLEPLPTRQTHPFNSPALPAWMLLRGCEVNRSCTFAGAILAFVPTPSLIFLAAVLANTCYRPARPALPTGVTSSTACCTSTGSGAELPGLGKEGVLYFELFAALLAGYLDVELPTEMMTEEAG